MDDIYKKMAQRTFGGEAAPRKRPASPNGGVEPKKPVVAPNGPSQGQPAVTPASNGPFQGQPAATPAPTGPSQAPATTPGPALKKKERIPAIFLDEIADWPAHAAKMIAATKGDFKAVARGKGYRIHTTSVEGFRALQRYLYCEKLPFYTHAFKARGNSLKVVLKGLPTTTEADLADALEEEGFGIETVSRLRTSRGPTRSWLVTLIPDCDREVENTKTAAEIYRLTTLFFVRVAVSAYKKPPGPTQCHRCQGFGHGSSYCGRPIKCVRCGGPHRRAGCQKPAEEKGVCCNCGGQHNASYRGCPTYKQARTAAKEATCRRTEAKKAPAAKRQPAPQEAEQEEASGDEVASDSESGFSTVRRRKRPPRNPANRRQGPRPPPPRAREEEGKTPAPEPRSTPRQKIDWDPRRMAAPTAKQPTAIAEEPATSGPKRSSDLAGLLVEVLQQLTSLTGLLAEALRLQRPIQA